MIKKSIYFILIFFLSSYFNISFADNRNNTLKNIESIINTEITNWSYSTDGKIWKKYDQLGKSLNFEKVFFKTEIKEQKIFSGVKVSGTPLYLELSFFSRGLLEVKAYTDEVLKDTFMLGDSKGYYKSMKRRVKLSDSITGKSCILKLEIVNKGFKPERTHFWPKRGTPLKEDGIYLGIREAALYYPKADKLNKNIKKWILSMKTASILTNPELLRYTFTGQPFKIKDNRKVSKSKLENLNKILEKSISTFDIKALRTGNRGQIERSIYNSYDIAKPLRNYAKKFKVFLIGNSHIDIAWLWRICETVFVVKNTFHTMLDNMNEYPELVYAQSSAITYKWMEEKFPKIFKEIQKRVKQGRWELVGGMWIEPDCNLIAGESWVRQILYGKKYFKNKFGVDINIGWNPDSFGYNWNIPQIYKKSGIDYFVTQKIWWNDTTIFPYFVFWWKGVDGTKILTYFPPMNYTSNVKLINTANAISKYEASTGYKKSLILYGLGDHGGGPNREILNRVRSYKDIYISPQFIHSKAKDFLKNIERDLKANIPVFRDELYLEYHRGTYTTQAKIKTNNRKAEALLSQTEKLASISAFYGLNYPSAKLEKAWELVMTNQFHDILPGSSITPVYRDALEYYDKSKRILKKVKKDSLRKIGNQVDTLKVKGKAIIIINSLSWKRSDIVKLTFSSSINKNYTIVDIKGEEVPIEIEFDPYEEKINICFIAKDIPSLGYKIFSIIEGRANDIRLTGFSENFSAENNFYKIKINPKTGNLRSLYDKKLMREFIEDGKEGNILKIYEDRPERWDAWNIGYTGRSWELNKVDSVEVLKRSPVRTIIKVKKSFLGLSKDRYSPTEDFPSSFFTQYITLYNDIDRIDIKTEADWWESHMMLKAEFPVSVKSDYAYYEIPFATIKRTTRFNTLKEKARFEVSALKWVDLSDKNYGISILNNGKYGFDIHSNIMKISLLRSPTWPDKMADRGRHTFTYSIYTHKGKWYNSDTVKKGYELNNPLISMILKKHKGKLPEVYSFFSVKGDGIVLDTIKRSEDSNAFIMRLYESKGKEEKAILRLPNSPLKVYETNLMEKNIKELKCKGMHINLKFKKYEIKTIKVLFKNK